MTAPAIDQDAAPDAAIPENAHPIRLPVMAIEGLETADGRYLEPGGISHRALPLTMYAQIQTPNGGKGHDNSMIVGAVTDMVRRPGPEVISKTTGLPFPEGTFVWSGTGWVYTNVRFSESGPSVFEMIKDRALSGNSIDLSDVIAEQEYEPGTENDADAVPVRLTMHQGVIGATTLVGLPAFPDAFIELDGELMVPGDGQAITAAAISWRSIELGDDCAACRAGQPLAADHDVPEGDAPPARRDGMIALVPADPGALAVDGGDPAEELHLTLAYLGDDVLKWTPQALEGIHEVARSLAASFPSGGIEARAFARAEFNPDGGPDGDRDPCAVYLIGDAEQVGHLRGAIVDQLQQVIGNADMPEQHEPFVPHVTAGYGVDLGKLQAIGPMKFDRIRVALGGDVTDYPIGEQEQAIVAAALPVLPSAAFEVPEPDVYTPPYITEPDDNGHRWYAGHIAQWNACHIAYQGKCVTPPRSGSKYAHFHLGLARTDKGDIPAGVIAFNRADQRRGGHADLRLSAADAVAFYDNTATVGADVRVIDGKIGPWACGVVRSDLDDMDLHRLRMSMPSGDWRRIRGRLDMVSVLHVNTPGFSGPRTLVASGEPMAMVAGAHIPPGWEGAVGPFESEYAEPHVYARDVMSGAGNCMCGGGLEDPVHIAPAPGVPFPESMQRDDRATGPDAGLVTSTGTTFAEQVTNGTAASADIQRILDMTGVTYGFLVFQAEVDILLAVHGAELANWVEKAGGLPKYIKRIEKHLEAKGMDKSRAIATAVNAAKKMCATGDTSLPGEQQINAGSRAEACAAVAEWEAKKAK